MLWRVREEVHVRGALCVGNVEAREEATLQWDIVGLRAGLVYGMSVPCAPMPGRARGDASERLPHGLLWGLRDSLSVLVPFL